MTKTNKVQFNIYLPEHHRNQLRRMAAEETLKNPDRIVTGTSLAAEIISQYLEKREIQDERGDNKGETGI